MKVKFLLIICSFFVFGEAISQITKTQVGLTRYDLQTNNSIERRIVLNKTTGQVVIAYTGSMDPDGYNGAFINRGTGYFYYSGTGALTPVTTFPGRIENGTRTGWPNPLMLSGGKEAVISHISTSSSNGLYMAGRGTVGSGAWVERPITPGAETWPRAANSGDSIIVISSIYPTGNNATMFGMRGGIGKKVSLDGGLSWSPDVTLGLDSIPGINLGKYPNVTSGSESGNVLGGDRYALDVNGSEVAVLTGFYDVTLYRSSDFGNTWTSTTLISGDNNATSAQNYDNRSSGDFSVLIDNNGKTHCFWALQYGNGESFQLPDMGIVYWNDVTANMTPTVIRQTQYGKETGPSPIMYYPFDFFRVFKSSNAPNFNQIVYGAGYTMQPSSGIDASGNLYLSFARIRGISDTSRYLDGKMFDTNGNFFYDCYLVKSTDNGATWQGPLNISNSDSTECVYPSIARDVDNYVHIVYQEDNSVGAGINDQNSTVGSNKMIYAKVPVGDIVSATDIPPVLKAKSDSFTAYVGKNQDTLRFLVGCNYEVESKLVFTDVRSFAKAYLLDAYDNEDIGDVLYIDSGGFDINTKGEYKLTFYAKDNQGNNSLYFVYQNANGSYIVSSWDTLYYTVIVDAGDTEPPTITLTKPNEYIYLGNGGNPYTLPTPLATFQDNDVCSTPVPTFPNASDVDVNKIGKYELIVSAVDGNNNKSEATYTVYVGKEPETSFDNEEITSDNKYVKATGTTDDISPEFPNTKYIWTTKKSTNTLTTSTSDPDLDYTIKTSGSVTKEFDSLCYQVENIFTTKLKNEAKVKQVCKELKYRKSTGGGNSIHAINGGEITFAVTPNPSSGAFELEYNGISKPVNATIFITDIKGSVISTQVERLNGNGSVSMNLKNLSNGLYFVNTEINNQTYLQKIEIKK